jgi:hypothetical protein
MMNEQDDNTLSPRSGLPYLLGSIAAIAIVWLIVLPSLAQQPAVKARLEWLEERKIDPSARYYTDLEMMEPILERLNRGEPIIVLPRGEGGRRPDEGASGQ